MGSAPGGSIIGKFRRLEGRDRRLVMEAVLALLVARVKLLVFSFERLSAKLDASSGVPAGTDDEELLGRISYAVAAAANHVPWRSDCFPQCIAARDMLRKRDIASTIHLGVERVGEADLEGHAWLTCGDTVVTGAGANLERFTELHRYPG